MHECRRIARSILLIVFLCVFAVPSASFASETDGTILAGKTNAELTVDGSFVNFGLAGGNVHVTDTGLTGYAWGETIGWILLDPDQAGVVMATPGNGVLSGYAWGQNAGWVNFAPTQGGVTIGGSGQFSGYAWSQNYGWIKFDCSSADTCVETDWRPRSQRAACNNSIDDDGDGQIDMADTGCSALSDTSETNSTAAPIIPSTNPPPVVPPDPLGPDPVTDPDVSEPQPDPVDPTPDPVTDPAPDPQVTEPVGGVEPSQPAAPSSSSGTPSNSGSGAPLVPEGPASSPALLGRARAAVSSIAGFLSSEAGETASRAASAVGLAGAVVASIVSALAANPLALADLFLLPAKIWSLLLVAFGFKKKHRAWGTVYDAVTKQPLDPAYVVLQDREGNEVATSITDLDGRYGFLVQPGAYKMLANKAKHTYPSVMLSGKAADEVYDNLYFGEEITVSSEGEVIAKNIPLDPIDFDWNEYVKKEQKLMKFYSKRDYFLARVSTALFTIGFAVSVLAFAVSQSTYNSIILGVYVILLVLRLTVLKTRPQGRVTYHASGLPLQFAIVRVHSAALQKEILRKVTDRKGMFYCLVPPGTYYVTIEQKNADQSYALVHTSEPMEVKKGYINRHFRV